MNIKNKNIVITGASQGLGKALAIKLGSMGGRIALVARHEELLNEVKKEINNGGGEAEVFVCDITEFDQVKKTVEKILEKFETIDILVNGAGIWTTDEFEEKNPKLIEEAFKVNIIGHIYFTKTVLPLMKKINKGHILNVISKAGLDLDENKDWPTYTATKWAMNGYTKSLRNSLVATKIKVSAIYPGGFESNIFETAGEEEAHNQPWMMKTSEVVDAAVYVLNQPENLLIDSVVINSKYYEGN
ncbi:MAG: SDR family oxidoreductase [Candidatus Shapirobacteria bacterium]